MFLQDCFLDTQACNSDYRLHSFRSYFRIVLWSRDCHVTIKYLVTEELFLTFTLFSALFLQSLPKCTYFRKFHEIPDQKQLIDSVVFANSQRSIYLCSSLHWKLYYVSQFLLWFVSNGLLLLKTKAWKIIEKALR